MRRSYTEYIIVSLRLAIGCCIFSVPALGQSDVGTIVGFVRDQSGAVVPGAE